MYLDSGSIRASRRLHVPSAAVGAVLLLVAHIALLIVFGHSPSVGVWSDYLQLASVLFATIVCVLTARRSTGIARPFWYLTAMTLASWSLGKCIGLYDSHYLAVAPSLLLPFFCFFSRLLQCS